MEVKIQIVNREKFANNVESVDTEGLLVVGKTIFDGGMTIYKKD